ncbi:SDR family NAD(P)-dependent oxidoreductase [Hymenobacter properus]|uniref:SDR family NAD(P)-dependent oxidoreductase n=1 Tax=Hymenobacter properus TaxID=2791026 RepID=A0A931FPH7_9BACT|nr:SDR family NAD(P)-dependent oxidoreductase [Hymenobacter properus]MBF9143639.1 SDR family NAD(P)-dependent oxidoreductase [Hymenobacter properus]MBR7722452.1 SDR family NAD(P)-dependent oxidoreductase [Microvirga sp. SRT04]
MNSPQTWFITGASQGLGLGLATQLLAAGHRVAATSRHLASLTAAISEPTESFLPLAVDLPSEASVAQAIDATISTFGRLDVVVNNAGYGMGGSIEEMSDAETRHSFETNVFGALNVIRKALPHLRAQGSGHIINISSIAAMAGATGWAIYAATKAAMSAFTEVLAQDVADFGLKVTVVEPGALRTNFLAPESLVMARQPIAEYEAVRASHARYLTLNGAQAGDPAKAAAAIIRLAREKNPPLHLLLGADAYERAQAKLTSLGQQFDTWQAVSKSIAFD